MTNNRFKRLSQLANELDINWRQLKRQLSQIPNALIAPSKRGAPYLVDMHVLESRAPTQNQLQALQDQINRLQEQLVLVYQVLQLPDCDQTVTDFD